MLNPRYGAYLKTTRSPKNYEYISFIGKMKRLYLRDRKIDGDTIRDQDDFTKFIVCEVSCETN